MAQQLQIEATISESMLDQIRIMLRQEFESAFKKEYSEKLLSGTAARKRFEPEISRGTFYNYGKAGLLKPINLDGKDWYRLSDIIAAGERIKRYSPAKSKMHAA